MSLSVCLITKNEERNIARALRSVSQVADEIVVADTGSTDHTTQIARDLGASVYEFDWIDDFSAARNFSVSRASKDWIFWLDADEELLPHSYEEVQRCLQRDDALGYLVLRQDLWNRQEPESATEMWQLRLFRRRDDLKFVGRCHPDFRPPLHEVAKVEKKHVYRTSISLRHYGYIEELRESKLRRAAKLLKLELEDRPGQPYYQIEYGRTLLQLGDEVGHAVLREATKRMLEERQEKTPSLPMYAALIEYLLVTSPQTTQCPLNRFELDELAARWFPDSAPLLWLRAHHRFEAQDFDGAAALLRKLVEMGKRGSYDKSKSFDPRIIGNDAVLNLAVCYTRSGRLAKAEPLFRTLLDKPGWATQAKQNLDAVQQLRREFK